MSLNLSDQQLAAIDAEGGAPVAVFDARTKQRYYIVAADEFEQLRALLSEVPFDAREMYPLIAKTAAAAGWNDPIMDEYNNYDEHKSQGQSR